MKRVRKYFILISIIFVFGSAEIFSQSNKSNPPVHSVLIGINSDSILGVEFGYQRQLTILNKDIELYSRFRLPLLLNLKKGSWNNFEFTMGMNCRWFSERTFGLISDINLYIMHHKQILGSFTPLGFNLKFTPCINISKAYIGIQINWMQIIATYIKNSDFVKDTFHSLPGELIRYPHKNPVDGWYKATGTYLNMGLEGMMEISYPFSFYMDLGFTFYNTLYKGSFDGMMIGAIPFYVNMRVIYNMQ